MNNFLSTSLALGTMSLAQIVPTASHSQILIVLLGGAALLVFANEAMKFWRGLSGPLKEIPPPALTYPTLIHCAEEHKKNADEHKTFYDALQKIAADGFQRSDTLRLEVKTDVKGIHNRIDDVLKAVSRLEGRQT